MPESGTYTAYSLIDLTSTRVTNSKSKDIIGYNQEQNYNVFLQLLGMRSQPIIYTQKILLKQQLSNYEFGSQYTGEHTVWKIDFSTEYEGAWCKGDDMTYHLHYDSHDAPITSGLHETADVGKSINTLTHPNLYFRIKT